MTTPASLNSCSGGSAPGVGRHGLGGVHSASRCRHADRSQVLYELRAAFPGRDAERDRELARLFAMLADDDPKTLAAVAAKLTDNSDPVDDIHYLICLARLTAPRTEEVTSLVKNALLDLDRKMTACGVGRDRHWPLRIAELHAELARRDPTLNDRIVTDPDFARPANVLYTRCPGFDRARAARRFYDRATAIREFAWTPEVVTLMGELPAEKCPPAPQHALGARRPGRRHCAITRPQPAAGRSRQVSARLAVTATGTDQGLHGRAGQTAGPRRRGRVAGTRACPPGSAIQRARPRPASGSPGGCRR